MLRHKQSKSAKHWDSFLSHCIDHMGQVALEALHCLCQFWCICIRCRESGLERKGNDVRHAGMRNSMMQVSHLYTTQWPCQLSPIPCSGTESYWSSHCAEKLNSAPLQITFSITYLGTGLGPYTKNLLRVRELVRFTKVKLLGDYLSNYTAYIHFGRLWLSNTNLSISGTMSQSDKCMSQYDTIVSHAH